MERKSYGALSPSQPSLGPHTQVRLQPVESSGRSVHIGWRLRPWQVKLIKSALQARHWDPRITLGELEMLISPPQAFPAFFNQAPGMTDKETPLYRAQFYSFYFLGQAI